VHDRLSLVSRSTSEHLKLLELTLAEPESGKLRKRGKLLVVPKQGVAADAVQAVRQTRKDRR
jgi:hypothetical protein